jgi:Ni,Fe-hydrogenase maturation factor
MKKVLVFGNELVKSDSLALVVAREISQSGKLKDVEFKELDAVEEIQNEGKDLVILDVVQGIKKLTIITDFDQLKNSQIYTLHDFDLGMNLKLLKKLGYIETIRIIGIPMNWKKEKAIAEVKSAIEKL